MDAAVLAGAAKLQLNQADKAAAVETAKKAFNANRSRQRFGSDIIESVTFSVEGNSLYAKGSADLQTVLANVVGMDTAAAAGNQRGNGRKRNQARSRRSPTASSSCR